MAEPESLYVAIQLIESATNLENGSAVPTVLHTMIVLIAVLAALYLAVRLTLRYYFPPDT
jgi:hypothetical protein